MAKINFNNSPPTLFFHPFDLMWMKLYDFHLINKGGKVFYSCQYYVFNYASAWEDYNDNKFTTEYQLIPFKFEA